MDNKMILSVLKWRKDLHEFYKNHNRIIMMAVKGIGALVLFLSLNSLYHNNSKMMLALAIGFAVICSVLPVKYMYMANVFLAALHLWQVSWDLAVFFAAVVFVSWVLICRMQPDAGVIIAFTPLLFVCKVPFLMPLLVGLFSTLYGIGAMVFGIFFYFLGSYSSNISALLSSAAASDNILAVQSVMTAFSTDGEFLLLMTACVIGAVVTYILCHQSFDYSWYIGCVAGGIAGLVVYLGGGIMFEIQHGSMVYMLTIPVAMCIACLFQFMRCIIDYSGVEYVEFEDDDYYYYVKAVPKVNVIVEDFALIDEAKSKTAKKEEQEEKKEERKETEEEQETITEKQETMK